MGNRFTNAQNPNDPETNRPAEQGNDQGLDEELTQNGSRWCADRFSYADFTSPFPHRDQHHVHHAKTAQQQRHDPDRTQEYFMPSVIWRNALASCTVSQMGQASLSFGS